MSITVAYIVTDNPSMYKNSRVAFQVFAESEREKEREREREKGGRGAIAQLLSNAKLNWSQPVFNTKYIEGSTTCLCALLLVIISRKKVLIKRPSFIKYLPIAVIEGDIFLRIV